MIKMSESSPKPLSFIKFFIDNYRVTYLLLIGIIVFGSLAIFQMPKESAPEVDIPVIVVTTSLPGAGSGNVESLITEPIENQVTGISEVSRIDSMSQQGISTVIVQFEASADTSEKMAEVRDRIDRARAGFPGTAGDPMIQRISFSDMPIMRLALSGPYDPSELKIYAEELKTEIESISNVSQVNITGAPEREIVVNLNEQNLHRLGLLSGSVVGAISRTNIDAPLGVIETGGRNYTLRFDDSLTSAEDLRSIPVGESRGVPVYLSEVAEVKDGFSSLGQVNRFGAFGRGIQSTVSLQIFKESGQGDILTISDRTEDKIENLKETYFPADIGVEVVSSDADIIRSDLNTLITGGLLTVMIIILILALFLGIKEAFLASLVVPFSFLIAFIFIEGVGLTINFLTLFSLILSLGILVDAAIVVTESIFEKRASGVPGGQAVIDTVSEFQAPLITGTLTTVFVFLPMLLVSGVTGEFIRSIPITVSAVLLAALFVALAVVTTIAVRFFKKDDKVVLRSGSLGVGCLFKDFSGWYRKKLEWVIFHRIFRYSFLGLMIVAFFVVMSFPVIGLVSVNMFPSPDADNIFIDLQADPGTPLEETAEMVEPIEEYLINDPHVSSFLTVIGQGSRAGSIDMDSGVSSHVAGITITLTDESRPTSQEILSDYRSRFNGFPRAEVRVSQMEAGPTADQAIQINVIGPDLEDLEMAARELTGQLSEIEGVVNADDGISATAGEFLITADRDKLRRYGLSSADLAEYLRGAVSGQVATDIQVLDDEVEIRVFSGPGHDRFGVGLASLVSIDDIRSLSIQTPRGVVALDMFLDVKLKPGRSTINRRDGDRVISLTSDVASGYNSPEIITRFQELVEERGLPEEVELSYGGEIDEIQESFIDLGRSLLVGVLMIFALMVWQFQSFRQPIFVLVTIPLALIGVFLGLSLVGQPLSFPGFIGIIALAGVVVNNAIILIDTVNKRYYSGENIFEAVTNGAQSRFRPVILTALTTVFGLIPLVFVSPVWAPVAYSIIFGLVFSTILTLVVIPILLYQFPKAGKGSESEQ